VFISQPGIAFYLYSQYGGKHLFFYAYLFSPGRVQNLPGPYRVETNRNDEYIHEKLPTVMAGSKGVLPSRASSVLEEETHIKNSIILGNRELPLIQNAKLRFFV
jgi:hypothetical protein